MNPGHPYTWIGFYEAYDSGKLRDELLSRRVGEIREATRIACEFPQSSRDARLGTYLEGALKGLSGSAEKPR
jgi:hypothetical protein